MEDVKTENKQEVNQEEKLSYEQLNTLAHNLGNQYQKVCQELQKANLNNLFKRLDYLFKVVENKDSFDKEFIDKTVKEITELMTIPEEKNESK